jgi:hypothetical protein
MSQTPEEKVPDGYYAAFYKCILKVLFRKKISDTYEKLIINIIGPCFERHYNYSSDYFKL